METKTEASTSARHNNEQVDYTANNKEIVAYASERWPEILTANGIELLCLSGKHTKCPIHGGKDGFRFINKNKNKGKWVCATCTGGKFEDGFNLIARHHNYTNKEAFKSVAIYLGLNGKITREDKKELEIRTIEAKNKREAEEKDKEGQKLLSKKKASSYADSIIANCSTQPHPYLVAKGITDSFLVNTKQYKITGSQTVYVGALIIPMYDIADHEQLIGAQFINANTSKGYIIGTITPDCIHVIEGDDRLDYVAVVEGYATGLSVSMAIGATVIVAFDANGMISKAMRLKDSFLGKQVIFFGDNDANNVGQHAAHTAAARIHGFTIIPPEEGDWDDYRKKYGLETAKKEINQQLAEFGTCIEIKDKITGLSINNSILLKNGKGISFNNALINHTGESCFCPISGSDAVIHSDGIWSYTKQKKIIPILVSLYDTKLIEECRSLKKSKRRLAWLKEYKTQKHIYAFVYCSSYRLGADIPDNEFNEWLYQKTGLEACSEILIFIICLFEARVNHAKKHFLLNPKGFNNRIHLKQELQNDGSLRINYTPAIEESKNNKYKLIVIKINHGQGKTQSFIKPVFQWAKSQGGAVYITHRRQLVAQAAKTLGSFHYSEDKKEIKFIGKVPDLACCLHSFKNDHNLIHINDGYIFIDEASQVIKSLFSDKNIHPDLPDKLTEELKKSKCILLVDADLTTKNIKIIQKQTGIKDNEVLIISAEQPVNDFFANISVSCSRQGYKNPVIESIEQDFLLDIPCVLFSESEKTARSIYELIQKRFPEKKSILLTGKQLLIGEKEGNIKNFIENIVSQTSNIDLFIHTSVIGTGVSVQHQDKRFKKGYALLSGSVLNAPEAIQGLRRFRDIDEWSIGILCRPLNLFMTSPNTDLGAMAARNNKIDQAETMTIAAEIRFNNLINKTLFIPGFIGLLRKYGFKIIGQLASEDTIEDLKSHEELTEEDISDLMNAAPKYLKQPPLSKKEMLSAEAFNCLTHFKIETVTQEAAEIWLIHCKKYASERLEKIIKIIRLDESILDVQKKKEILAIAGITIKLFKTQTLNQNAIQILRNDIAKVCDLLVSLELLPERYSKAFKIPKERPLGFISEFLKGIGLDVETKRATNGDRELDISLPVPIVSRLCLDVRTDKEMLRDKALNLKSNGFGYGLIAKELGLTKKQAQRLLK